MRRKKTVYEMIFKRPIDFMLSLFTIVILLPLFIIFTPVVAVIMKGNPFFTQERTGKNMKVFKILKYRTMTNDKDKNGFLLPDDMRLTKFGIFIRKTSIDELPSLFNILVGQMSIVGPRPLLVSYLPYYTKEENKRHAVRPGLTGLSQVSGRNHLKWDKRLQLDVKYTNRITFIQDLKIILLTFKNVFLRKNIAVGSEHTMQDFDEERKKSKFQ